MKRSELYTLEYKLSQLEKDARDVAAMIANEAPNHASRFQAMAEYTAHFATQVRIDEAIPKDKAPKQSMSVLPRTPKRLPT